MEAALLLSSEHGARGSGVPPVVPDVVVEGRGPVAAVESTSGTRQGCGTNSRSTKTYANTHGQGQRR
jgi:hypothetical protein